MTFDESPDKPAGWYDRGYLPHFDDGGPTFVTYRLNDSLPESVVCELSDRPERERHRSIESLLDSGFGDCVLERPEVAEIIIENLHFFDGQKYRVNEWVVMPNHVHVLLDRLDAPLKKVLQSWKSYTSKRIQDILPANLTPEDGRLWQPGYFDRSIRDKYHYWCVQRYIILNPVDARLCESPWGWEWSSAANHDEQYLGEPLRRWFRAYEGDFDGLLFESSD